MKETNLFSLGDVLLISLMTFLITLNLVYKPESELSLLTITGVIFVLVLYINIYNSNHEARRSLRKHENKK